MSNGAHLLKILSNEFPTFLVDPKLFVKEKLIGKGGYAEVWLAVNQRTKERVAIKQLYQSITAKQVRSFAREIQTMSFGNHPFFLKFLGFTATAPLMLVSEYMPNRSLYRFLRSTHRQAFLTSTHRTLIAMGIAHAMNVLHSNGIIHRDLKSMNILLDSNFLPRLCDFGIARFVDKAENMTAHIGTPHWMAPEVLNDEKYGFPADVYSFGMLLFELQTNKIPWAGKEPAVVIKLICTDKARPEIPVETTPEPIRKLMQLCWAQKPEKRPDFRQIYHLFRSNQVSFEGTDIDQVAKLDAKLKKFIKNNKNQPSLEQKSGKIIQTNTELSSSKSESLFEDEIIANNEILSNKNKIIKNEDESIDGDMPSTSLSDSLNDDDGNNIDNDFFQGELNNSTKRNGKIISPFKVNNNKVTAEVIYDDDTTETAETNSQIIRHDSKLNFNLGQKNTITSTKDEDSVSNTLPGNGGKAVEMINLEVLRNPKSLRFQKELRKASKSLSKSQMNYFFSLISEYFNRKIDEKTAESILETVFILLATRKRAIYHFTNLQLQNKLFYTNKNLTESSLEILRILFSKNPNIFHDEFSKQMTSIIKTNPQKAIVLLAYLAKLSDSYDDKWELLDLIIKKSEDFFNSNVGSELVSILYNLCNKSKEYKDNRIQHCINIFQKGIETDGIDPQTVANCYNCLSTFFDDSIDSKMANFDLKRLIKDLKNEETTKSVLSILLRMRHIPRKQSMVNALLLTANEYVEANICLIRIAYRSEGADLLMNDISWVSKRLPTLADTLSLFLTVFYFVDNRDYIINSRHTSALIISLCQQKESESIFYISCIFKSVRIKEEMFEKLLRREVFDSIVDVALELKDEKTLRYTLDIIINVSAFQFADCFLNLFELIGKALNKWPKLFSKIITMLLVSAKYEQCVKQIKKFNINKIIDRNINDELRHSKHVLQLFDMLK